MDTQDKLKLLADASRFDLACACATTKNEHRQRTKEGLWLYPVALPNGGSSIILKTLLSNLCTNDCGYCPYRKNQDTPRTTLAPEELSKLFINYVQARKVFGLFLSSGVINTPDYTMERMSAVAEILRKKHNYRGYLHLKIIPGASEAAIEKVVSLANTVSLNVEVPKALNFQELSHTKNFEKDIVKPLKFIAKLTGPDTQYAKVKKTTQFIVGAANEKDSDIIKATWKLYKNLNLNRVYFSAYQKGLGDPQLPGETTSTSPHSLLTREHRLYQTDFLIRKYHWSLSDFSFNTTGNLSLVLDPKQQWAEQHPEFFPIKLSSANYYTLLRVPGIGPITAKKIIQQRQQGNIIKFTDLGLGEKQTLKVAKYTVIR